MLFFVNLVLAAIFLLDFFLPREQLDVVRSRSIDYWIFVQELPLKDELAEHVVKIRAFLRLHVIKIFILLTCVLISLALVILTSNLWFAYSNPSKFIEIDRGGLTSTIKNHFDFRIAGIARTLDYEKLDALQESGDETGANELEESLNKEFEEDVTSDYGSHNAVCEAAPETDKCVELRSGIANARADRNSVLNALGSDDHAVQEELALKVALARAAVAFIQAAIFAVSFAVSLFVTLRLLKAMERIRLVSILVCALDVALAFAIPLIAIAFVATIAISLSPIGYASALDDVGLQPTSRIAYTLASSYFFGRYLALTMTPGYLPFAIRIHDLGLLLKIADLWRLFCLFEFDLFLHDMRTVFQGNWRSIAPIDAERNWTVASSIGFSLFYICGVVFLMLAKRYQLFREMVSTLLQFLADHPRGPLAAAAVILAAVINFAHGLL